METLMTWLVPLSLAAVVIVLFLGLFNMVRAGPANRSQMLMRWRVILQFVAIVVMMGALYISTR